MTTRTRVVDLRCKIFNMSGLPSQCRRDGFEDEARRWESKLTKYKTQLDAAEARLGPNDLEPVRKDRKGWMPPTEYRKWLQQQVVTMREGQRQALLTTYGLQHPGPAIGC